MALSVQIKAGVGGGGGEGKSTESGRERTERGCGELYWRGGGQAD